MHEMPVFRQHSILFKRIMKQIIKNHNLYKGVILLINMKERAYCKKCEKEVKPDSEMVTNKPSKNVEYDVVCNTIYKCPDCNGVIPEKDVTLTKFNFNECLTVANCLQKAINHQDIIGDVDHKIGDIKKCRECGKVTDVVFYNGCLEHCSNTSSTCSACYTGVTKKLDNPDALKSVSKEDHDWMQECIESEKMYKEVYSVVENIMSTTPPISDSVVELEKVTNTAREILDSKYKIDEYELALENQFINKCAELDLIDKNRYVQSTEQKSIEIDKDASKSVIKIMELVYDYVPPISDSVIERDRISWFVHNLHDDKTQLSMREYENLVNGGFAGMCAKMNILGA